ncbi:hypothetical protein BDM02DRAFT_595470 [Thelephora ganbajun]|uniref:Uncharacterized protein n=1 Tax=Thelephora ganbajun TaxID=370292 RepID=A0ACB6Z743_THEGA|nr:hypothetical protein BDM02DRAFT_595470 [Thelephora ganbajun]
MRDTRERAPSACSSKVRQAHANDTRFFGLTRSRWSTTSWVNSLTPVSLPTPLAIMGKKKSPSNDRMWALGPRTFGKYVPVHHHPPGASSAAITLLTCETSPSKMWEPLSRRQIGDG